MLVKLTYFKQNGKYYSDGEYNTNLTEYYSVINEVRNMKREGNLPGLIEGSNEGIILVTIEEMYNVPHLVL
jgi:hypothetical protein